MADGKITPEVADTGDRTPSPVDGLPHVVIIGAGFGGLACALALGEGSRPDPRIRVTVIDRKNYHLFVPLLYQVATAALSPADIAAPIRQVMSKHHNIDTVLAEVDSIDAAGRKVMITGGGFVPYDALVVATGAVYNYFGNEAWAPFAPGVKTIENARAIRARLLRAFEAAEIENDEARRKELLTIVVIGGGPTGVEMAGTIAELARYTLAKDFRRIDPAWAEVILIEAGPRILAGFPEAISRYALTALEKIGVNVWLNTRVEAIDQTSVMANGHRTAASSVIWGAGIRAAPAAAWLGAPECDRQGRIMVGSDLSLPGYERIYAIGDLARFDQKGTPLPALAQVAKQQGQFLGKALRRSVPRALAGKKVKPGRFVYRSRGDTAVIGRSSAVFVIGPLHLTGMLAWLMWGFVHVYLLIGFDRRVSVAGQWVWRYMTSERGARLID